MIIPEIGSGYLRAWRHSQCPKKGAVTPPLSRFFGQLAFPWVLQEKGRYTCVLFYFYQRNPAMAGQVPWSVPKCQSTERGKTLFLKAFQAEPVQRPGWLFSHQNRIALVGLEELFKPRGSNVPEEARKWGNDGWTHSFNIQLKKSSSVWQPHGILGQQLSRRDT